MKDFVKNNKNRIIDFFVLLAFSVFTYSELMVNQLVNNYDGIWEGSYHIAGPWELSLGRWFWFYLSKLRFGIATDPATSIIALMLFVGGILLFADIMEVRSRIILYVCGAAFICTPLVCISLSYRYMSPTFATAFFLAVLSMWLAVRIKKLWIAIPIGGLTLALSMGSYQAYLGVACVIILAYFIKLLLSEENIKGCLLKMIAPISSVLVGGILYIILLKIHLAVNKVEMSNYMGADGYSLMNSIKEFPNMFVAMYRAFGLIIQEKFCYFNRFAKFYILYLVMAVLVAVFVYFILKRIRKNIAKIICLLIAIALMPAAAFAIQFISTSAPLSLQMTGGFFMVIPALACALPISFEEKTDGKILCGTIATLLFVYSYGGFYQVQADQSAMKEGMTSTTSITDTVIEKMIDLDYLDPEYKYCFIGSAYASPLYTIDYSTDKCNSYALFGNWWGGYNSQKSWRGVVNDVMGLKLNIVNEQEYNNLQSTVDVVNMPVFPYEGSIILIDDIVVIKVSE